MALVSPKNTMKLKNIKAARRIINGSPKIRDVLRERCRQRMHERRNEIFEKRRQGLTNYSQEVKDALTDIVHEEFDNMASMEWTDSLKSLKSTVEFGYPLNQDEALAMEDEINIEEIMEEQWILEEYQKMLWEQKELQALFADNLLYCPICCKHLLKEVSNFVVCCCGLKLPVLQGGLQQLKQNIQEQVNAHSTACLDVPKFSLFQDGDNVSLYFSCASCDIFALV